MKGSTSIDKETKLVLFLLALLFIISIANYAYYRGTLYAHLDYLTDFHANLLGHRLAVIFGLLICFIGIWVKRLRGKVISLLSTLIILALYLFWYYEKFKWFEVAGLKDGSVEYTNRLNEIGWFRGANQWDFIVLFSVLVLMFWIIFRYKNNYSKLLQ